MAVLLSVAGLVVSRKVDPREKLRRDIQKAVKVLIKRGEPQIGHWTGGYLYRRILEAKQKLNELLEQI